MNLRNYEAERGSPDHCAFFWLCTDQPEYIPRPDLPVNGGLPSFWRRKHAQGLRRAPSPKKEHNSALLRAAIDAEVPFDSPSVWDFAKSCFILSDRLLPRRCGKPR